MVIGGGANVTCELETVSTVGYGILIITVVYWTYLPIIVRQRLMLTYDGILWGLCVPDGDISSLLCEFSWYDGAILNCSFSYTVFVWG